MTTQNGNVGLKNLVAAICHEFFPGTYEGKRAQSKHKFGFQGCLIKGGWSSFLFCDFLRMITDDDADPLEYHN